MLAISFLKQVAISLILGFLLAFAACDTHPLTPPEEPGRWGPGDYGGPALAGMEDLYNLTLSPDGTRIALTRKRTPGQEEGTSDDPPMDPVDQLWIVNADGTNPQFIAGNVLIAQWAPDNQRLLIGMTVGIASYVFTLDLNTMEATQWSGSSNNYLSYATASPGGWFKDGKRILIFVWGQAYQQPYQRGAYVIDTETSQIEGPLLDYFQSTRLGNNESYIMGQKYTPLDHDEADRNGNWARLDLESNSWTYITDMPTDSTEFLTVKPNPVGTEATLEYRVHYANQLFLMDQYGSDLRQITELGGGNARWTHDGTRVFFRRDSHVGPGAHWVPMVYDVRTGNEYVLWPDLENFVPQFPPINASRTDIVFAL